MRSSGFAFMYFLTPVAIMLNCVVLLTLKYGFRHQQSFELRHILLKSLAVADLATCLVGFTIEDVFTSYVTCVLAGHVIFTSAMVSMMHIVALSFERLLSIKFPFQSQVWFASKRFAATFVIAIWFYGYMWASLFPTLRWGAYAYESKLDHRCSIDLVSSDVVRQSYVYALLVFCYLFPIAGTVICFVIVKMEFTKMMLRATSITGSKKSAAARASARQHRAFTFIVAVMLTVFTATWTPYAVTILYRRSGGRLPQVTIDICAYIGKTSALWNPIIYFFMYRKFQRALVRVFLIPCFKRFRVVSGTTDHQLRHGNTSRHGSSRRSTMALTAFAGLPNYRISVSNNNNTNNKAVVCSDERNEINTNGKQISKIKK